MSRVAGMQSSFLLSQAQLFMVIMYNQELTITYSLTEQLYCIHFVLTHCLVELLPFKIHILIFQLCDLFFIQNE